MRGPVGQIDIVRRACEEGIRRGGLGLGDKIGDGPRAQKAGDGDNAGLIKAPAAGRDEGTVIKRAGQRVDNPVKQHHISRAEARSITHRASILARIGPGCQKPGLPVDADRL